MEQLDIFNSENRKYSFLAIEPNYDFQCNFERNLKSAVNHFDIDFFSSSRDLLNSPKLEYCDIVFLDSDFLYHSSLEEWKKIESNSPASAKIVLSEDGCQKLDKTYYQVHDIISKEVINPEILKRSIFYAINKNDSIHAIKEAEESREQFLARVSHELRTPLSSVIGLSELLLKNENSEDKQELEIIYGCGRQLLSLVNDLLAFSGSDSLESKGQKHWLTLKNWVEDLSRTNANIAPAKVQFSLSLGMNLPTSIRVDSAKVEQILNNLISNAFKFTSRGQVSLNVASADDSQISFTVEDTGRGIPKAKLKKIFEPFRQVETFRTSSKGGLGLGLAISKKLADSLGGEISAESTLGEGSKFTLTIPVQTSGQVNSFYTTNNCLRLPRGQKLKILLVEDTYSNRFFLKRILEKFGHEVTEAIDGYQAVEAFEKGDFDLILLDLQMPRMDGIEASKRIRQIEITRSVEFKVPIIAVTAHIEAQKELCCMEAGMNDFLTKPVNIKQLEETISKVCYKADNIEFRRFDF